MPKKTTEEIRGLFEAACKSPITRKKVVFPLAAMIVNDVFHHYMDSDTDSAWIGFHMGFRVAESEAAKVDRLQG